MTDAPLLRVNPLSDDHCVAALKHPCLTSPLGTSRPGPGLAGMNLPVHSCRPLRTLSASPNGDWKATAPRRRWKGWRVGCSRDRASAESGCRVNRMSWTCPGAAARCPDTRFNLWLQ